ncbi:hypothetical protein ACP275_08G183900 [Erythranthe tilingii]
MASKLLQLPIQTIKTSKPLSNFRQTTIILSSSFSIATQHQLQLICYHTDENPHTKSRTQCTLSTSSSSSPKPPTTKEEAILQARTSLSSALEKPLNNPKLAGKIKKVKQPRFRVEIPVIDDAPASLSQLAVEVFGEMPLRRKGSTIKILILWPNKDSTQAAVKAFNFHSSSDILVQNIDMSSILDVDIRTANSADVAVFLSPEVSQVAVVKRVTDSMYPKPAVIFNPKWGFEEEANLGEMKGFVGSFDVVYSFMGLEVRGIFSKRKGVVFKCVKNGVSSGENWYILVEEDDGNLRVVSRFKSRPPISEVENVLYNLMAINSPVTKSAKFLKDLVSNVTGKK